MCRKRVGVIFGGRSAEHEISLKSAATVAEALNSDKFVPVYIGITKKGVWKTFSGDAKQIESGEWERYAEETAINDLKSQIDFALPILHGPYGEDGCIQGMLELMGIPYGGCGVLASAAAMDKQLFKEVLRYRGLPVCRSLLVDGQSADDGDGAADAAEMIEEELGLPCFIKPANMGSSVGITKAQDRKALEDAIKKAALYDRRIIAEEFVPCRELEIAFLGGKNAEVSTVGEIIPSKDFYDYTAKYSEQESPSRLVIPADISEEDRKEIRRIALEAYRAIDGYGFCRADFFKDRKTGKIYINEINTIPGFTAGSMFPLLWEAGGRGLPEIIERIIDLGYERYYAENNRQTEI